jgi:hypothetical protein
VHLVHKPQRLVRDAHDLFQGRPALQHLHGVIPDMQSEVARLRIGECDPQAVTGLRLPPKHRRTTSLLPGVPGFCPDRV